MSANLHELTKQLDVLSWNSRSVLNALIRSAMAAGSSSGFTVKRAGEDVSLSRDNIAILSDFYEEWESIGYVGGSDFNSLLNRIGGRYEGGMLVESLVKHAKIMWMDSTNVSEKDNYDYWLYRIATMENPKWMTNTAPIPLSIRTPIYDENLSTKHFDEYETYLFPSAYYSMDTLGYSGDGNTHSGGGQNWTFDVDETFNVKSDRVILGTQDLDLAAVNEVSYGTAPLYSLAGGTNSFAYGLNSVAYGCNNQAYDKHSAIVGGYGNITIGSMSGILGGRQNCAVSSGIGIAGGVGNNVLGSYSFAANENNFVGGYHYTFVREVASSEPTTECRKEITVGNCKYRSVNGEVSTGSSSIGTNQIFVPNYIIERSDVPKKKLFTKKPNSTSTESPFDFDVGDLVTLHSFVLDKSKDVQRACDKLFAKVSQIEQLDSGYRVTLTQTTGSPLELSASFIPSLGDDVVLGGKICREMYVGVRINAITGYGAPGSISTIGSSVHGFNNISCGEYQTVVGSSNNELTRARFIVGVGKTSYVTNETETINRANGLVVAPGYSYAQTTSYCTFGLSNFTTSMRNEYLFTGGENPAGPLPWDEDFYLYGVEKYEGTYAYSVDPANPDTQRSVFRVFHKSSLLMNNKSGVRMEPNGSYTGVHSELFSNDGNVAIHASSDGWGWYDQYVSQYFDDGSDPEHIPVGNVAIWAANKVGICGNLRVSIVAGCFDPTYGDTRGYGEIEIMGKAYKSLTAYPNQNGLDAYMTTNKAKGLDTMADVYGVRLDAIPACGHYCTPLSPDDTGLAVTDQDALCLYKNMAAVHSFVSSRFVGDGKYDVASIILPGVLADSINRNTPDAQLPHPVVSVAMVDPSTNTTSRDSNKGFIFKELAYRSDADAASAKVASNIGTLAYTLTGDAHTAFDQTPNVNDAAGYYHVTDAFLRSIPSSRYTDMANGAVTSAESTKQKLIYRPGSFSGYANKCTTLPLHGSTGETYTYEQFFVNGVRINPIMRMEAAESDGDIIGVTYFAYGTKDMYDQYVTYNRGIDYIYQTQMNSTSLTNPAVARTLNTSKFSSGADGVEYPNDLRDIWILAGDGENDLDWRPAIRNLLVAYSSGKLSIEFQLDTAILSDAKMLCATATGATGNECVYNDSKNFTNGKRWADSGISFAYINLPIDPSIGNYMSPVGSASGACANMYGEAVGVGVTPVSVFGTFTRYPVTRGADGQWIPASVHNVPMVKINLAKAISSFDSSPDVLVHLEGMVNYEY